jgi:hypothetical protein
LAVRLSCPVFPSRAGRSLLVKDQGHCLATFSSGNARSGPGRRQGLTGKASACRSGNEAAGGPGYHFAPAATQQSLRPCIQRAPDRQGSTVLPGIPCAPALGQAVLTPGTGRRPAAGAWRRGLAGDLFRIRPGADAGLPLAAISGHRTEARPRPLRRSGCGAMSHRVSARSGRSRRPAERHDRHEGTAKAAPAVQGNQWRSKRQMPVVWPGWVDRLSCAAAGRGPLGAPAMETPRRRAKMEPGWRCGRQDIRPRSAPEARCLVQISTPCGIFGPGDRGH